LCPFFEAVIEKQEMKKKKNALVVIKPLLEKISVVLNDHVVENE
jgi:Ethanolamine utilization protein EutJ (predicted chaperonin)